MMHSKILYKYRTEENTNKFKSRSIRNKPEKYILKGTY